VRPGKPGPGRVTSCAPGWARVTQLCGRRVAIASVVAGALLLGAAPGTVRLDARPVASGAISSPNWAGYAAHRAGTQFTNVHGSWAQPVVHCPQEGTYSSFWVGLDGYLSDDVEQVGTSADCVQANVPSYYAWYEMYPAPRVRIGMVIRPGDHLEAQVSSVGGGTSVSLRNLTLGRVYTSTQEATTGPLNSAEWVAEAPSACSASTCFVLPLSDFSTVPFYECSATATAGGSGTISSPSWSTDTITMIGSRGTVIAQPSAVTADGASFLVSHR
jgi:Peptidase A4 family